VIQTALEDIGRAEIDGLIANQVIEDETLEYNEYLPSDGRSKRGFLKIIVAFANSDGGDLVLGIQERRLGHKKSARPEVACGVELETLEETRQAIQSLIRDGTEPAISRVHFHEVPGYERGPVLVARVDRSLNGPHMVIYDQDRRFYARSPGGVYIMSSSELRRAFGFSESLGTKLRSLRDERIDLLAAGAGPVLMDESAKLALLLVPLSALSLAPPLDLATIPDIEWTTRLRPISGSSATFRYNIDGMLVASGNGGGQQQCPSYVQLFTDGRIEAVNSSLFRDPVPEIGQPDSWLVSSLFETELVALLSRLVTLEEAFSVQPPFFVLVSLLNSEGYKMSPRDGRFATRTSIDRERILLPEVVIEDYEFDGPSVLRPVFDAASRATGLPGSQYFDAGGEWTLGSRNG
jgi:hypothetical protein